MRGEACSAEFMRKFARLVDQGLTTAELCDLYCMGEREIQDLKRALETERAVKKEINLVSDLQPTHFMHIARAPAEAQAVIAQQAADTKANGGRWVVKDTIAAVQEAKAIVAETQARPHVFYNTGNNEWYTPPEYIAAARAVMGAIDLDPASSHIANRIVGATHYYTAEDDGLAHSWKGRVWMNPPYASELIGRFTGKLAEHFKAGDVPEAIVLVNNATETDWFRCLGILASAICFPDGRVKFLNREGQPTGAPLQGQAVLYLGSKLATFRQNFASFGLMFRA